MSWLCRIFGHRWFHRSLKGYWYSEQNQQGWECDGCGVAGEVVTNRVWSWFLWDWRAESTIRPAGKPPQ